MSVVERAAKALTAARAAFADAEALAALSEQELVDLLALAGDLTRVTDAQRVRLAGEIAKRSAAPDDESICRHLGGMRPRDAIASAFGIEGRQAGALLAVSELTSSAVSLTGETIAVKYPSVAAALDAGELSLGQARVIVKTLEPAAPRADLEQLARAEGWLVHSATDPATRLAPELLVTQARAFVAALDPDGVLPNAERQRESRGIVSWVLSDGTRKHLITSPPQEGGELDAALDSFCSPRVRFVDTPGAADEVVDDRTRAQKRFDGLMTMVSAEVASGGTPTAGGEVPRLVLTGTIEAYDAYLRGVEHPDRTLTIEHTGDLVPIEAADRIICDGIVQRAVTDANGHVLDLGREQRTFNRAQRRALAAHYRGCATSTCIVPVAGTEAHHVIWWSHGGPTDTENGILLCNHCHQEVHAGRLRVVGTRGDWRVVPALQPSYRYAPNRRSGLTLRPTLTPSDAATWLGPVFRGSARLTSDPHGAVPRASAPLTGSNQGSVAHAARPVLALKLPDAPLPAMRLPDPPPTAIDAIELRTSESVSIVRRPLRAFSPIEQRMRQRMPVEPRSGPPRLRIDRSPSRCIALRA